MKPPNDANAERAILGALLFKSSSLNQVRSLDATDFWDPVHRGIFAAVKTLADSKRPVDVVTVAEKLGPPDRKDLLVALLDSAYSAENISHHARIVSEKALARRCLDFARSVMTKISGGEDIAEVIAGAQTELAGMGKSLERGEPESLAAVMIRTISGLTQVRAGKLGGIPTGFSDLDSVIGGLRETELILLAARPGVGKTSLGLQFARNVAKLRIPVLVFSAEMGSTQLAERMLAADAHTDLGLLRRGCVENPDAWRRVVHSAPAIAKDTSLWLDETSSPAIGEIRAKAARWAAKQVKEQGRGLLVVDYLQLIRSGAPSSRESRQQQLGEVSRGLKGLAKDLRLPVVALAQLNRDVERRENKQPILSDLREAGDLENDADIVLMLARGSDENEDEAEVLIRKHRNGPLGAVKLRFVGSETRFETWQFQPNGANGTHASHSHPGDA